ncbi:MAG TPA: hypothetical protein VFQ85_09850 [Mycobacteriales bacterium]|jgi:hypothetical protein|nr:hypothetical protein [Mycobacteriales bacterium]
MIRRCLLAGAVALSAFAAQPAHAMDCTPVAADVCATVAFACSRLEYHRIYECDFQ